MLNSNQRISVVNNLLNTVDRILETLDKTEHYEVNQWLSWFKQSSPIVVAPVREELVNGEPEIIFHVIGDLAGQENRMVAKNAFSLYPMFQDDARLGQLTASYMRRVMFGSYGFNSHTVAINMESCETLRFMACVFLHSLGRAYLIAHANEPVWDIERMPFEQRLDYAVSVWTAEYRLAFSMGSEHCRQEARRTVAEIHQYGGGGSLTYWMGKGVALDDCFGPPPTYEAIINRETTFGIYCRLMAADMYLPPDEANRKKKDIMRLPQMERGSQG